MRSGSLYGALKSSTPLVLTAGQQDTRLRLRDPVLGHDLVAMAAPLVKWAAQVNNADELAAVMQRAISIANEAPKGPVFLALPINVMEQETTNIAWTAGPIYSETAPEAAGIAVAAELLARAQRPVIIAADDVARGGAVPALVALAERWGASVFQDRLRQHVVFPTRHPAYGGVLPLDASGIRTVLDAPDAVLILGGPFFEELWYEAAPAIPPGVPIVQLAHCSGVLARNFTVNVGLVGGLRTGIEMLSAALAPKVSAANVAARAATFETRLAKEREGVAPRSLNRTINVDDAVTRADRSRQGHTVEHCDRG